MTIIHLWDYRKKKESKKFRERLKAQLEEERSKRSSELTAEDRKSIEEYKKIYEALLNQKKDRYRFTDEKADQFAKDLTRLKAEIPKIVSVLEESDPKDVQGTKEQRIKWVVKGKPKLKLAPPSAQDINRLKALMSEAAST